MSRRNLLDCTLRDGSYITNGEFTERAIRDIISTLVNSRLDFIEVGYLNKTKRYCGNSTHWDCIERIADYIPQNRQSSTMLAMIDIDQFGIDDITPHSAQSVDGIRIVFYKHQVDEAMRYAGKIRKCGYKLFVQPMVTIDYTLDEYSSLCDRIAQLEPYAISIVDSFGYMAPPDFRQYYRVIDNIVPDATAIGVHSHQNKLLALPVAVDVFEYQTQRKLVVDCSLLGMGRGAGNLQTELIADYYNANFNNKYNVPKLLRLINEHIVPIQKEHTWGYSPYYFLTANNECHPNYAAFLLESHDVSINEFAEYLKMIPKEMRTKCRRPYVEEIYEEFLNKKGKSFC
ncbi:MAG: hypothetical protein LBO03_07820 [Acidaminococcales bacterium]|jgi:4-hydroxy 2-oxovalerate aldolase|nr:hypothetical protein [Acidaminococcales bacterium]